MMVRQAHHERLQTAPLTMSGCERLPLTLSLSKGRPELVEGFFISFLDLSVARARVFLVFLVFIALDVGQQ